MLSKQYIYTDILKIYLKLLGISNNLTSNLPIKYIIKVRLPKNFNETN